MGRVYQAQHIKLKKKVALKILHSNLVADKTVSKRFEREAHAASRLNHPNCITMFGFGEEDNGAILWMAMEFVQGRDLGTIIAEDAPLDVRRIIRIVGQVCEALDEAHSAKVVHRDLKPANIVCFDHRNKLDIVKVLDFGIAKIIDPDEDYQP
ncbi:serine/threonine protein kinase, partial [Myxococcota bacterium]|nr:serine/threonine protein kinase [Myxococcota bacterium]